MLTRAALRGCAPPLEDPWGTTLSRLFRRRLVVPLLAALRCRLRRPAKHRQVRDYISIVGSSTVYPFATVVAENSAAATPTSRRRRSSHGQRRRHQGVLRRRRRRASGHRQLVAPNHGERSRGLHQERRGGRSSRSRSATTASCSRTPKPAPHYQLTLREVYLALAKDVPDPAGGRSSCRIPNARGRRSTRRCRPTRSRCSVRRRPRARATRSTSS